MPIQLQIRRGLASQWLEANTTLAGGEIGYETDTGFFKIGTGNTVWANLKYTVSNTALTANNALFLNGNSALVLRTYTEDKAANAYSNSVTYVDTRIGVVNSAIIANAAAAYANAAIDSTAKATAAIIYADYILSVANSNIIANATTTYTNATTFSANATNLTNGTIPYGRFPVNIINTTADFTRAGVTTFNANLVVNTTAGISANGTFGTQGQALLSNGTSVYWATATAGSNTYIQFNDSGAANASAGFTFNKTTNTVSFGNSTVNASINSTAYTGSASFVGGNTAATLRSYSDNTAATAYANGVTYVDTRIGVVNTAITSNASAAYANAVTYTDGKIATANTSMVANAAAAYSNAVTYTDTRLITANTSMVANASAAYTNAVSYIDGKIGTANVAITGNAAAAYANSVTYTDGKILTANAAITGNAATAYSNAVTYVDTRIGIVNTAITGNSATAYANGVTYTDTRIGVVNTAITGNSATAYSNAVSYVDNKLYVNTSQLSSNLSLYGTLSGEASRVLGFTANNVTYVGSVTAANVVSNAQLQANLNNYLILTGGTINGPLVVNNNLTVTGNLTLSGNTLIVGANNLIVSDALISLHTPSNLGALTSNDGKNIGLALHYYDTSDKHAMLYRENSSGRLQYHTDGDDPQNNSNPQGSNLGIIQAASFWAGNGSVYTTTNATNYSGTANNTLYIGSVTAANIVSNAQLIANLVNYQTTAGLAGNVVTLTANLANYVIANTGIVSNSSGVFVNSAYISSISSVNANTANNALYLGSVAAASYQLNSTLAANVATLTSNNTSFVGTVSAANVVSNAQLSSNLANYALTSSLSSYQTTAGLSANVATLTSNNALYLGGVAAASYVNTTGSYSITGVHTHNANIVISTLAGISTNGTFGTSGQVLTTNGSVVYWANTGAGGFTNGQSISVNNFVITGSVTANSSNGTAGQALTTNGTSVYWSTIVGTNTAASYSWTNTHTFSSNVTLTTTSALIANGLPGTAGQMLTSNGTSVYWSTVTSGGTFTNGQSISVANFTVTGSVTANGGTGTAGQILTSNGSASYWANSGAAAATAVRQSYTGDGTTTSFTVSGGYTAGQVSVFLNGVMLRNGTEVTVTSGTAVVFGSAPPTGALIDVIGSLTVVPTGITAGKAITLALIFGG